MLDERARFIAAIRAAEEDDDVPTLIYADWLEERGDEARARFIRAQVAAEREPDPARAATLLEIATDWFRTASPSPDWGTGLPSGVRWSRHHRGLIRALEAHGIEPLIRHGPEIVRRVPLVALRVRGVIGDEGLIRLLDEPWLADVVELAVSGNEIGADGARALGRSPSMPRLRRLDLRFNDLGDSGLEALADSPLRARLEALRLSDNKFGAEGARALVGFGAWPRLKMLAVSFNLLGDEGCFLLADPLALPALCVLEACEVAMTDVGLGQLYRGRTPGEFELIQMSNPIRRGVGEKVPYTQSLRLGLRPVWLLG